MKPSPLSDRSIPRGTKLRAERPERIALADGDCLLRNDLVAAEIGLSVRGLARYDADGAPFVFVGGVKYRPLGAFRQYLASRVKQRTKPAKRSARR
jgi:hypothetical protein